MPKICYRPKAFRAPARRLVEHADSILEEYRARGFRLTLRGLYYKFIARDLFPEDRRWKWTGTRWARDSEGTKNAQPNYDLLQRIVSEARLAGLIDWLSVADTTRNLAENPHWESPREMVEQCAGQFMTDRWEGQRHRLECWVEKDAQAGVIGPICEALDVPRFSSRGYNSQSEMWEAAQRLKGHAERGYTVTVLYLGDHDPSGLDMSRDIRDRLTAFMDGEECLIERLALNWRQVAAMGLPPSPAKVTDSRYAAYVEQFGPDCWELDALEPEFVQALIEDAVKAHRDDAEWRAAVESDEEGRLRLLEAAESL